MNIREIVKENPLLAILRNVPMDITVDYVQAIFDGGVRFFEVALNSVNAYEQIRMLRARFGGRAYVGAGTAITVERARAAVDAGAQFLLSPSTDPEVLAWCRDNAVAIMPGCLTPSDVTCCLRHGFDTIKLFPAGDMPKNYIKSLKGPLDGTEYVAIGGVNPENVVDFIRQGYIGAGMGSNMLPRAAVEARDWDACRDHVAGMLARVREALGE